MQPVKLCSHGLLLLVNLVNSLDTNNTYFDVLNNFEILIELFLQLKQSVSFREHQSSGDLDSKFTTNLRLRSQTMNATWINKIKRRNAHCLLQISYYTRCIQIIHESVETQCWQTSQLVDDGGVSFSNEILIIIHTPNVPNTCTKMINKPQHIQKMFDINTIGLVYGITVFLRISS